ncbi:MAG: DUF58 domain-containing protein [Longimicrobiaceae bacterium]
MPAAAGTLLSPELLERLGGLEIIARRVVGGFVAGRHRSPHRGSGEEFARHRPYQQGDDLRYLDWKLYGRTDRLYAREFREESNLRAYLVLDGSRSMAYAGRSGLTKHRYAVLLAAVLGHLMLASSDAVGLATFGGGDRLLLPPRNRKGHLHDLLLQLERLSTDGAGGASRVLDRVGERLPRRGRVILISDLLEPDDGDFLLSAVGRLRARGDEVMVMRILTPAELGDEPPGAGRFFDPESPEQEIPAVPEKDQGYTRRLGRYYARLAAGLRDRGAEYLPLTTRDPLERALAVWVAARGV